MLQGVCRYNHPIFETFHSRIYISHRLSSCRFCNGIVVFEEGNIVQHGNHKSLVNEKGLYAKMWNAQAQYYADPKNTVAFQEQ